MIQVRGEGFEWKQDEKKETERPKTSSERRKVSREKRARKL